LLAKLVKNALQTSHHAIDPKKCALKFCTVSQSQLSLVCFFSSTLLEVFAVLLFCCCSSLSLLANSSQLEVVNVVSALIVYSKARKNKVKAKIKRKLKVNCAVAGIMDISRIFLWLKLLFLFLFCCCWNPLRY